MKRNGKTPWEDASAFYDSENLSPRRKERKDRVFSLSVSFRVFRGYLSGKTRRTRKGTDGKKYIGIVSQISLFGKSLAKKQGTQ